ncbi:hypothetical protein [Ruegeria lacuscaerulensis]|uniref:hypothetical protein n=1 Tax=Ruegeria lacuscaerulensis TaxID=55218 RepID=UPI001BE4B440|nr:hypothetical protein [Ruegeria lacuscaerulensis]
MATAARAAVLTIFILSSQTLSVRGVEDLAASFAVAQVNVKPTNRMQQEKIEILKKFEILAIIRK